MMHAFSVGGVFAAMFSLIPGISGAAEPIPLKPGDSWAVTESDVGKTVSCAGKDDEKQPKLRPGLHFKRTQNDGFVTLTDISYVRSDVSYPLLCQDHTMAAICSKEGPQVQVVNVKCRKWRASDSEVIYLSSDGQFRQIFDSRHAAYGIVDQIDCR